MCIRDSIETSQAVGVCANAVYSLYFNSEYVSRKSVVKTSSKNLVIVKAKRKNKVANFMPKPIFGDNASAMHTHQSLWNENKNEMYDQNDDVAQMSQTGRYYVGGILSHASALCAISNPTTNSYKRLVPGFEAPVNVCWGLANRSTAIRIPMYLSLIHISEPTRRS